MFLPVRNSFVISVIAIIFIFFWLVPKCSSSSTNGLVIGVDYQNNTNSSTKGVYNQMTSSKALDAGVSLKEGDEEGRGVKLKSVLDRLEENSNIFVMGSLV